MEFCDRLCQPVCEAQILIECLLYHDVFHNEHKTLGLEGLLSLPLGGWVKARLGHSFAQRLTLIRSCTQCGECEQTCPYGLSIMQMLEDRVAEHLAMIQAARESGWTKRYAHAL